MILWWNAGKDNSFLGHLVFDPTNLRPSPEAIPPHKNQITHLQPQQIENTHASMSFLELPSSKRPTPIKLEYHHLPTSKIQVSRASGYTLKTRQVAKFFTFQL